MKSLKVEWVSWFIKQKIHWFSFSLININMRIKILFILFIPDDMLNNAIKEWNCLTLVYVVMAKMAAIRGDWETHEYCIQEAMGV